MFAVDHKAAESDILPKGEYECIIVSANQTVNHNGTPVIHIALKIRDDIENPGSGAIFYDLWMRRNPTEADQACEGWSAKQIQKLSKAAGLPNGKNYESIANWCEDLPCRAVRVTLGHGEWNGHINAEVKWVNETRFPLKPGSVPLRDNREPDFIPPAEDDDDLPF